MYKFISLFILIFLSVMSSSGFTQPTQIWATAFNGPSNRNDIPTSMAIDAGGNIYVTGSTSTPSTFSNASDFATIKYNSSGVQQWVAYYNGPVSPDSSYDVANSIAVDAAGNVYVTGTSFGGATSYDWVTIKYNSAGVQRRVKRYNDSFNSSDGGTGIVIDNSGVYVTGQTTFSGSISEITTIKYDTAGTQQWLMGYIGTGDMSSSPSKIKLDASSNVYVCGQSNHLGSNDNYAVVKYNSAGVLQWAQTYNGTGNIQDDANDIAIDNSGNVFVTGESWTTGSNLDYVTIKYNSGGVQQWLKRYNGPGNSTDSPIGIALDVSGNVVVTGYSLGVGTTYDITTIKYNSLADTTWTRRYDFGPGGNRDDRPTGMVLDNFGNVYVTGSSSSSTFNDYVTIKYNPAGDQQWVKRYNGTGSNDDAAVAIAIDNSLNLFVTGSSWSAANIDYLTIKYSQPVGITPIGNSIPESFKLAQNYPNPFNPTTNINYDLPVSEFVSLKIYDQLGKEVATLVNERQSAGSYRVEFDGSNFSSGIYFYTLSAGEFKETKKMLLVK